MDNKEKFEAIKKAKLKQFLEKACDLHPKDYDYQCEIMEIMRDMFLCAWEWGWREAKQEYTFIHSN